MARAVPSALALHLGGLAARVVKRSARTGRETGAMSRNGHVGQGVSVDQQLDNTGSRSSEQAAPPAGDMTGLSGWVITDGKIGMDVQAIGVAEALGLDFEMKRVAPRGFSRLFAPYWPVARSERFGTPGSQFSPPWPEVAIATGRLSIPYMKRLRREAGPSAFTVVLQDPKTDAAIADVIWVPAHDRRRGANVITTLTAPHSFNAERLAALRGDLPAHIAALPSPRLGVVIGGPNAIYKFEESDVSAFLAALSRILPHVGSVLVTPSRRTPATLLNAVRQSLTPIPHVIWDGEGTNPYPHMLACADLLIVTADSVNMTGEACATGRPVYVFEPNGGSAKFNRFHEALRTYGATRPLVGATLPPEVWTYEPLDATSQIAAEVIRRWRDWRAARTK